MNPSLPSSHSLTVAVVCLILGVLILLFGISCSSPTAPSSTLQFVFAPAPGCTPGEIHAPRPMSNPFAVLNLAQVQAWWLIDGKSVGYEFKNVGGLWLVCKAI
jgi:hypothetical protein